MNLMEAILNGGGSPLTTLGKKFGIGQDSIQQVVQEYLPALTNGMKQNISQKGGLDNLLNALNKGNHDRYLDDSDALDAEGAIEDGNGILGHLLGSKDTSRQLAKRTAKKTGLDAGVLKKILPLVAGLTMGALKKQGNRSGILTGLSSQKSSSIGALTSMLDADGDGSPIDDLLGFAKKLF